MYRHETIETFVQALASKEAVPGGGGAAALGGALGAALASMVCRLTLGKKSYAEAQEMAKQTLEESDPLWSELLDLIDRDAQAYAEVMAAYRLQRSLDGQRGDLEDRLQQALSVAIEVPLQIAERCARILELAAPLAEHGNRWAATDAAAAALLAEACMRAALLNVDINLKSVSNPDFVQLVRRRVEQITAGKGELCEQILAITMERIS